MNSKFIFIEGAYFLLDFIFMMLRRQLCKSEPCKNYNCSHASVWMKVFYETVCRCPVPLLNDTEELRDAELKGPL